MRQAISAEQPDEKSVVLVVMEPDIRLKFSELSDQLAGEI
jgi:hypothetical protein